MVTKREVKAYFGAVKKVLRHVPERQKIAKDMQHEVEIYLAEHPEATAEDMAVFFGEPEQIARVLTADMPAEELVKRIRKARFVKYLTVITAVALIAIFVAFMVGIAIYNKNIQPVYYTSYIIEN